MAVRVFLCAGPCREISRLKPGTVRARAGEALLLDRRLKKKKNKIIILFMKRLSRSLIMAALILVMVGGCQKKQNKGTAYSPTAGENFITVGFAQVGSESDWRMASTASIQEAFEEAQGITMLYKDGQQKQENQIKAIREFIDQDVDYILLDPCIETGWDSALLEAKEAGIPVIIFDRDVTAPEDLYTAWVGSDFYLEGQRACAWLGAYLEGRSPSSEINIVGIQGTLGATAQLGRTRALEEAAASEERWNLMEEQPGDFTTAKGKEVMEDYIRKFRNKINVVYCENDNEAYGAIEALEEHGYTVGLDLRKGEVLVLSFDATREGLKLTQGGKIAVNTECSPLYGPRLLEMIEALERGETLPKRTYIEEEQFSGYRMIGTIKVGEERYHVTHLTDEIMEEREY